MNTPAQSAPAAGRRGVGTGARIGACTSAEPGAARMNAAPSPWHNLLLALSWLLLALCALPAAMAAPPAPPATALAAKLAAELAPLPAITARVTDQTGTLSSSERATLEQTLQAFETRKGSQLLVLIIASTAPESIEQYALRVVEKVKPGRKKVDDGVLLLVAKNDRTMRIEVGYGLEGALNDAISKRIISETITPLFQRGDFYGGITAGVTQMMHVMEGETLPPPARGSAANDGVPGWQSWAPVIFLLALGLGRILRALFGRLPGALATGTLVWLIAWLLLGALSIAIVAGLLATFLTLGGGRMGGYMLGGIGRGDGGRFGGGGGGGFSGGGGGFGGGGASGRW